MNEKEKTRVLGGTTAVRLLEVRLGPTSLYTFPIYIHIYEGVQGMDTATRVRMYIPYLPVTCFLQPSAPKGEFWGGGKRRRRRCRWYATARFHPCLLLPEEQSCWAFFFLGLIHQRLWLFCVFLSNWLWLEGHSSDWFLSFDPDYWLSCCFLQECDTMSHSPVSPLIRSDS